MCCQGQCNNNVSARLKTCSAENSPSLLDTPSATQLRPQQAGVKTIDGNPCHSDPKIAQPTRSVWGGKAEFIFSCLSYAVGLGNVWRYPYLCYKNGGGAFLLPFTVMLLILGAPMLFLESAFGQYTASGPVSVWKISPLFEGIGWSMFLVTFFASIYYCMLIGWTMFYFFASFSKQVPWKECDPLWSTEACVNVAKQIDINNCTASNGFFSFRNNSCLWPPQAAGYDEDSSAYNTTSFGPSYWIASGLNATNSSLLKDFLGSIVPKTPSEEYFYNYVLKMSSGLHDVGVPRWELALCLLLSWIVIVICMVRGVQSAGKAVYFTALFPYIVLTILFIRGLMLEGSLEGLRYYFIPKWELLKSSKVWGEAAIQIFFSLNPCWGGIIALSSYNRFRNNAFLDSMIVAFGDGLTSIYAGMVIFTILGYMSHLMQLPVDQVVKSGAGLAFVVYPDIVTSFPLSPVWAVLFFLMLLMLGFGTMIAEVNCLYTSVLDKWPMTLRVGRVRPFLALCGIASVMYLLGLSCTTRGGVYVLQWLDNYAATYSVLVVGFLELVVIGWVYGIDRFISDIEEMLNMKLSIIWKIMWKYVSPLSLLALLIFSLLEAKPSTYGNYVFPATADILGGCLSLLTIMPIPAIAIYKIARSDLPLPWYKRARELMKPAKSYGPRMGERVGPCSDFESEKTLVGSVTTHGSAYPPSGLA